MIVRGWWLCFLLVPTTGAHAQRVHGVVYDALSHRPIPGAVVSVLDSSGHSVGRDLTNSVGEYSLATSSAADRLRVVRIGFSPYDTTLAPPAGDEEVDVTLQPLPSLLQRVSVRQAIECPPRPDRSRALGLWEQARAALLASVAARETRPGDMQILEYRRLYDRAKRVLYWQQVRVTPSRTARPFVPAVAGSTLVRRGYEVHDENGTELAAPDADILLDDSFAASHCFSLAEPNSARPDEVGLAFAPAPGRAQLVDIRGVLWIDRAHPALRSLEFRYTGLAKERTTAGSGGRMEYRSMPNGVVFIASWSIDAVEGGGGHIVPGIVPSAVRRQAKGSVTVSGGEVLTAHWNDSTWWAAPTASIRGRVHGVTGVDTAGVRIWLLNTGDTTASDSAGRFRFDGLLPGSYRVAAAAAPSLAEAGIAQNIRGDSAVATLGDTVQVVVHLDSAAIAARNVCAHPSGAMPATVLLIHVVNADRWNMPWDSVTASWKKPSTRVLGIPIAHQGRSLAMTDPEGRVALCNLPRDTAISVLVGPHWLPQDSTSITLPRDHPVVLMTLQAKPPHSH